MTAETLVLVPGLSCTQELFAPQIRAFEADRPILVADHRQDDTLTEIARRLLAAAPDRFALAGLSMGGYVAFEVMRLAPERVTRLALLDTSARPDTPEGAQARAEMIALAESGRLDEVHRRLWPRLVHPDRVADASLEGVVRSMMAATGPEAFVRQERAILGRPDSRPDLPGIAVPTLVLVGEADVLTPVDAAREMAEGIAGAALAVIEGSGHLATLERQEPVTAALRRWLAG